jgi:hypothetical protein
MRVGETYHALYSLFAAYQLRLNRDASNQRRAAA